LVDVDSNSGAWLVLAGGVVAGAPAVAAAWLSSSVRATKHQIDAEKAKIRLEAYTELLALSGPGALWLAVQDVAHSATGEPHARGPEVAVWQDDFDRAVARVLLLGTPAVRKATEEFDQSMVNVRSAVRQEAHEWQAIDVPVSPLELSGKADIKPMADARRALIDSMREDVAPPA
jgi:hypothetical protein